MKSEDEIKFWQVERRSPVSALDKLFMFIIVLGSALTKTSLFPLTLSGISVADILIACALIFLFIRFSLRGFRFQFHPVLCYIPLFWLWTLLGSLFLITAIPYFSIEEFGLSFLKLSFYGLAAIFILFFLKDSGINVIRRIVLNVLLLNAFIAIYIYVVMLFEIDLPYQFFWYGQSESARLMFAAYYRDTHFVVAKGFFSEPSMLGIFQSMGLAFLHLLPHPRVKMFGWKDGIVIMSILLTFSLSAYFLMASTLLLYLLKHRMFQLRSVIVLISTILLLSMVLPFFTIFQTAITHRLVNVFQLLDISANSRLFGSWEIALKAMTMSDSLLFGVGLGNLSVFYEIMTPALRFISSLEGGEGWNILAYVLGTTGVVGFTILILMILNLIKRNPFLGTIFLAYTFATGALLEASFWVFYSLYSFPDLQNRINK